MSLISTHCTNSNTKLIVIVFGLHVWPYLWKYPYVMTETCRRNIFIWTSVRSWKLIQVCTKNIFYFIDIRLLLKFPSNCNYRRSSCWLRWYEQSEMAHPSSKKCYSSTTAVTSSDNYRPTDSVTLQISRLSRRHVEVFLIKYGDGNTTNFFVRSA